MPDVEIAGRSDVGRARAGAPNEDAILLPDRGDPDADVRIAVADGMGGAAAGEVASALAIETLARATIVDAARDLPAALVRAGAAIHARAQADLALAGMGTTLVAALLRDREAWVAHVGDSRAYRWRDGALERLTRDHSLVQEAVDAGRLTADEARTHPRRNVITRSLGTRPEVAVDVARHALAPGDLLLLCSDGLTEPLDDATLAALLAAHARAPVDELAGALVDAANAAGGPDNVSVVVARASRDAGADPAS